MQKIIALFKRNIINKINLIKRKILFTNESVTFYGDHAAEFQSESLKNYLKMKKCLLFNVGGKGKFARKAVIGKIQTKQNKAVVLFCF